MEPGSKPDPVLLAGESQRPPPASKPDPVLLTGERKPSPLLAVTECNTTTLEEAETPVHWSEDRPPTNRASWTHRRAQLYLLHQNPLDTEPRCESDVLDAGFYNAFRLENLLTADELLPTSADASTLLLLADIQQKFNPGVMLYLRAAFPSPLPDDF